MWLTGPQSSRCASIRIFYSASILWVFTPHPFGFNGFANPDSRFSLWILSGEPLVSDNRRIHQKIPNMLSDVFQDLLSPPPLQFPVTDESLWTAYALVVHSFIHSQLLLLLQDAPNYSLVFRESFVLNGVEILYCPPALMVVSRYLTIFVGILCCRCCYHPNWFNLYANARNHQMIIRIRSSGSDVIPDMSWLLANQALIDGASTFDLLDHPLIKVSVSHLPLLEIVISSVPYIPGCLDVSITRCPYILSSLDGLSWGANCLTSASSVLTDHMIPFGDYYPTNPLFENLMSSSPDTIAFGKWYPLLLISVLLLSGLYPLFLSCVI